VAGAKFFISGGSKLQHSENSKFNNSKPEIEIDFVSTAFVTLCIVLKNAVICLD